MYISLPITNRGVRSAKIMANKAKERLERIDGVTAVTPFDVCMGEEDYATCMGLDIAELLRCDMVCFLSGWERSKGCALEYEAARIYGKKIIYLYDKNKYGK